MMNYGAVADDDELSSRVEEPSDLRVQPVQFRQVLVDESADGEVVSTRRQRRCSDIGLLEPAVRTSGARPLFPLLMASP